MKITNLDTKQTLTINPNNLINVSTKSLYVRKGWKNGTLFISQRGNGAWGAGDICKLTEDVEVRGNLFDRLRIYAEKANAIIQ